MSIIQQKNPKTPLPRAQTSKRELRLKQFRPEYLKIYSCSKFWKVFQGDQVVK